ncbi:MAG: hypothetical protein ABW141_17960 [Candidatus Thiodiazotropha endolucinida]
MKSGSLNSWTNWPKPTNFTGSGEPRRRSVKASASAAAKGRRIKSNNPASAGIAISRAVAD